MLLAEKDIADMIPYLTLLHYSILTQGRQVLAMSLKDQATGQESCLMDVLKVFVCLAEDQTPDFLFSKQTPEPLGTKYFLFTFGMYS